MDIFDMISFLMYDHDTALERHYWAITNKTCYLYYYCRTTNNEIIIIATLLSWEIISSLYDMKIKMEKTNNVNAISKNEPIDLHISSLMFQAHVQFL